MMLRTIITSLILMFFTASVNAETIKVKLVTTKGDIHIDLYADKAPVTVANFLKYVDGGHYDNSAFYRTVRMDNQDQSPVKIEVIQGGNMIREGATSFEPITLERTNETGIMHVNGAISMARSEPDSATSEFFICINDQPALDFAGARNSDGQGFAAFGKVTAGMDVVKAIQASGTNIPENEVGFMRDQRIAKPVIIETITRE